MGLRVAIDEPYQHYQFAGRADVAVANLDARALLHIENRTRFPNIGETAASFNAKRSYLAAAFAKRWGLRHGWASEDHAIVALWSAEVLHAIRLRTETFRALCPDPPLALQAWWAGEFPSGHGTTLSLVILDPSPSARDRDRFASLEEALRARPRYRDYADAATRLRAATGAISRGSPPSRASRGG
jgi:hypothetical protein